jgi:hypothetical protein
MQMYVSKNGQQLGPFEESKVAEMLQNGQLSPQDLGFKQGQSQWQKLEILFPTQPSGWNAPSFPPASTIQPMTPILPTSSIQPLPPTQSGGSKGLMFGVIGCGGLILLSILGGIGFFIWQGQKRGPFVVEEKNSNSTVNSNVKTPPPSDFTALKNKAEEFAKLAPPQKLAANPIIKGKIAIVEKNRDYPAEIKGIDYSGKELRQTDIEQYGFSTIRLATSPDQIETLIQIACNKGNRLGTYTGGIPAYANVCKTSIIDYKNSAIIAQKTFTNNSPPENIKTSSGTTEYVLSKPDEMDEYLSSLPVEKLSTPLVEQPFNNSGGTYGKYKGFIDLAAELSRLSFSESLNPSATIKGKFAVALKDANGRTSLKGFDLLGKEIYKYDYEKWGVGPERLAEKPDQIETLIKISCQKGSKLGTVKRTGVFSNKCEVSIIDYQAGSVVAKKSFENKEMRKDVDTDLYSEQYIVLYPYSQIDEYIKAFPK